MSSKSITKPAKSSLRFTGGSLEAPLLSLMSEVPGWLGSPRPDFLAIDALADESLVRVLPTTSRHCARPRAVPELPQLVGQVRISIDALVEHLRDLQSALDDWVYA